MYTVVKDDNKVPKISDRDESGADNEDDVLIEVPGQLGVQASEKCCCNGDDHKQRGITARMMRHH